MRHAALSNFCLHKQNILQYILFRHCLTMSHSNCKLMLTLWVALFWQTEASLSSREIVLWFPTARNLLEEKEMSHFVALTENYIRNYGGVDLVSFAVHGQFLQSVDQLPLSNVILFQSGADVFDTYITKEKALAIHVRVDAGKSTGAIVPLFSNHWEDYVSYLNNAGLAMFSPTLANTTAVRRNPENVWILAILLVSLASLTAVILARRSGRRRRQRMLPKSWYRDLHNTISRNQNLHPNHPLSQNSSSSTTNINTSVNLSLEADDGDNSCDRESVVHDCIVDYSDPISNIIVRNEDLNKLDTLSEHLHIKNDSLNGVV